MFSFQLPSPAIREKVVNIYVSCTTKDGDNQPHIYTTNPHHRRVFYSSVIITTGGDMVVKKLPIGVNDFSEMIEKGYYFVDKTLLIKDIVDLPGKIKLITRPRRFGKTLNMNMIRRFFSRDEKKDLFEGLKIWEEKEFVKEYYHKYPVIFVTFKELLIT